MKTALITGGAGFIGINTAIYFAEKGFHIIIFDNLSRKGTKHNLELLKKNIPEEQLEFVKGDVRTDLDKLKELVERADVVLHLAAQVAVTWSIQNPRNDFENNALGAFNVYDAVRTSKKRPFIIYSSTNKVYGDLEYLKLKELEKRYDFEDGRKGIDENTNIDLHSPYGCSKGAADLYLIDMCRIFNMKGVVFRQSCIYGPFQLGVEDQGWVAWFIIAALLNKPITIFGDGKQVRDILHVKDLVRLYHQAYLNKDKVSGKYYNIGGGYDNSYSLIELLERIQNHLGIKLDLTYSDTRSGDQKIFIADTNKTFKDLNWTPKISKKEGVEDLIKWLKENLSTIQKALNDE